MRVTVVTGVSRGLGAALVDRLLAAGDRVVALGRRFTEEQQARTGDGLVLHRADLTDPATLPGVDTLAPLFADATQVALVHNAAVVDPVGAVGELSPEEIRDAVTVNLTAAVVLSDAFVAALHTLPPQTPATVLYVSSGAAHQVVEGWPVYGATKRGGEAFVDALAAQFAEAPHRTAAVVQPGVMDTAMQQRVRAAAGGPQWFPAGEMFVAMHASGDLAEPGTVADRILAEYLPPPVDAS